MCLRLTYTFPFDRSWLLVARRVSEIRHPLSYCTCRFGHTAPRPDSPCVVPNIGKFLIVWGSSKSETGDRRARRESEVCSLRCMCCAHKTPVAYPASASPPPLKTTTMHFKFAPKLPRTPQSKGGWWQLDWCIFATIVLTPFWFELLPTQDRLSQHGIWVAMRSQVVVTSISNLYL